VNHSRSFAELVDFSFEVAQPLAQCFLGLVAFRIGFEFFWPHSNASEASEIHQLPFLPAFIAADSFSAYNSEANTNHCSFVDIQIRRPILLTPISETVFQGTEAFRFLTFFFGFKGADLFTCSLSAFAEEARSFFLSDQISS